MGSVQSDRLAGLFLIFPSLPGHIFQQLQERFETQRTGPNRVLVKVCLEEPERGIDGNFPNNQPQPMLAAIGDIGFNSIHHPKHGSREGWVKWKNRLFSSAE